MIAHRRLHVERSGRPGSPVVLFVHPNPLDAGCWLYQTTHLSMWYRTLAVDLPGYGLTPPWEAPFHLEEIASACWAAVDEEEGPPAAIVGCSAGAHVAMCMARLRPDGAECLALSGTGYHPPGVPKAFAGRRKAEFESLGLDYRRIYIRELFSPAFGDTSVARWFADQTLRRGRGDLATIMALFDALAVPDPEWFHADLGLPVLVMGGSEDASHHRAGALVDRLPDAEIVTLQGAGHACHIEKPWDYDDHLLDFLSRRTDTWVDTDQSTPA